MQPTQRDGMVSPQSRHPDGEPRQLTPAEEARIARILEPCPPIYRRHPKLAAVPDPKPTPRQPWDVEARAA